MGNKKKIIIAAIGILFLTLSVAVGVFLSQKVQKTETNAAGANLTLTTNVSAPKVGDTVVVAVAMNTNGLSVTGLDLNLKYDTNYLTATSITEGPFLSHVYIPGSISSGTAKIILGCPFDTTTNLPLPVSGTGLVAQVNFVVKAVGTSSVSFDSTATKVSASGQTTNMVGSMTGVQIAAVNPTPTPLAVGCNQTCGIGVPGNVCSAGLICYAPANANGGISATGVCRKSTCTSSTTCNCSNVTPTPSVIMCGGITGKVCPAGLKCIYSDGSGTAPFPDASGTCQNVTPRPSVRPSPTPVTVGCNQTCGIGVQGNVCSAGLICYSPTNSAAGISATGVCRKPTCATSATCNCGNVATPTPSAARCGGIQGLTCLKGTRCIYENGSSVPPYPDASGTCQPVVLQPSPTPVGYCTGTGACTTQICPTMKPCATGQGCAMVMPTCITINGFCRNSVCTAPTPSPSPKPATPSPTPIPFCGTGLYCSQNSSTTGATICRQQNTNQTVVYCCPAGKIIINNACATPKLGDVNKDGVVNIVDIGIIVDVYGQSPLTDARADLNNDGAANIVDIGIVIDYYGQ